ncbi:hypothetical protein [Helicobacter trogontum]|uniref:hypothetical protein n=1 Tax=Helicobacter trogontum TaxID=50960 RepID=UPI000A4976C3|nr:hypothetical protein [Helicobacter trogontum]
MHKKDSNTTYARAIEARFNQDTQNSQGKELDNKIQNISKEIDSTQYDDSNGCHIFNAEINKCIKLYPKELSDRTINFTNRFKLLFHQPNTESGFLLLYLVKKESKGIQNLKRLAIQVNMAISIIS